MKEVRHLIGGEWVPGDGMEHPVLDKFRGVPVATFRNAGTRQVEAAVAMAHAAFAAGAPVAHLRGHILQEASRLVGDRAEEFVGLMRQEAGFPRSDALGEVRRCMETLRLSAEEARRFCGDVLPLEGAPDQGERMGFTLRVPLGVVAAITPFNSPMNTVAHKIGPAFAAGNAVVLKPSTHTPMTACLLGELLVQAGIPRGFLSVLHGGADTVQTLQSQESVRFFAFTGSTEVGRIIQQAAGLRRTQMELGSIACTIVCADADLDRALPKIVNAAYRKAGQVCTSIQLLLVQSQIAQRVEQELSRRVRDLAFGDPSNEHTVVGPLISEEAAQRVGGWITEALALGARRLAGGDRVGSVVPPTLLANVDARMKVGCQEVFGPVMCLVPFDSLEDAFDRVNATPYGLATGIFTHRLSDALLAARRLQVGGVHVNETSSSRVDLMPYGGSKSSGFGREGPHYAIREMSEERVVTISS
ncbi:aldehyde dehydrogenase family protein [Hydrogenophaga sp. BPS33]|uniref:aldehyde dehydrogenase family protein n=1 Tax=Hydrogenophaga sp. BPS33 TaxID=2651974 RepID=UPI00131FD24C|nr:aldehyde dehydrogenase family protein [Hydrogenophaga sp. BPS33]QHE84296.1 aldehyde dehydrogenase family protein [Hydrogenophaga sp. BPS33]